LGAAILAMALLIVCTTFLGSSEYLITRSDVVRNQLETFSNERLKKFICDQREYLKKRYSLCPDKELMNSSEVTKLG